MSVDAYYNFYLILLHVIVILGLTKYKLLDTKGVIIYILLCFTLAGEYASKISQYYLEVKSPVYHFTAIISLIIIYIYYLQVSGRTFRGIKYIFLPLLFIIVGIVNVKYQKLIDLNTNTLILRGFLVIIMSIYIIYKILLDESIVHPLKNVDFLMCFFLLFLYGGTYFFWSYITLASNAKQFKLHNLALYIQITVNIIAYTGIGLVLYFANNNKIEHGKL